MPFETNQTPPRRVAVIGGGISGMGAAHALARNHHVVLFEAEPRLGGHARTVIAGKRGDQPVDTGFIVFNRVNYPNMVKLFEDLDVPIAASDMGFGASFGGGQFEYALRNIDTLFAQRRNAFNPAYLRMLADIHRFNTRAVSLADDPGQTIGQFLDRLGTGPWFRDRYILPLSGAIWSTPKEGILDFPAHALIRFFKNHALLGATGQHPWFTVRGGSVEYVRRLEASLAARGVDLRTGTPVAEVRRTVAGCEVTVAGQGAEPFDDVIFATHSDQSLAMLADPTPTERAALSAVRYQPNRAVLHADTSMMPRRRRAWASWVYTEAAERKSDRIDLTYWMNSLQPIPKDDPLFVTLNAQRDINPALIHDEVDFMHPVYDLAALAAQDTIRAINGQQGTWFCGAWMRNGFHEDGLASAYEVADALNLRPAVAA
ncbi:NAD(P)/FAD-dependent oxidoreductase [Oceaniglobus indicus]|uniref:NAD(P)/FAD-dependent oxidoreductase n=1 Tax=Oceaniglobus indicus TaxID=2047749 RepID=UPI000C1842CC|nr:FAD-dependent oxidoreductase [Oceaniglobus indicus]